MPPVVFIVLMLAASLHASWNTLIRGGNDRAGRGAAISMGSGLIGLFGLLFVRPVDWACWWPLAASAVIHVLSNKLTARAYNVTEMGLAYPLMRGVAPLLTTVASLLWLHEILSPLGWIGILTMSGGVGLLLFGRHGRWTREGLAVALANTGAIAAYSTIDGAGARLSGSPVAYALWVFALTGLLDFAVQHIVHNNRGLSPLRRHTMIGLGGGGASVLSYGAALWAMTRVPVALVAASREMSIAFGTLFAIILLRERVRPLRIAASLCIVGGVILLRMS